MWKWVSILQGYDLEIRHIPGRINPADTLTRQTWVGDAEYVANVKNVDKDMVELMRVTESATDRDIQKKLNELYSMEEIQIKKQAQEQLQREQGAEQAPAVLSVAESRVQLNDAEFKRELLQRIQEDEEYTEIVQKLLDPAETN